MMKMKSSLLVGLATLSLLFSGFAKGDLKGITKPYLGMYECVEAKWNGEDYLERFSCIELELKPKGSFVLHYAEQNGEKKSEEGRYSYNEARKTITLELGGSAFFKREFPLKDGVLNVQFQIGKENILLCFKQK